MKIYLAPMEGVVNARMRALLTSIGGLDRCVTEFVRVTRQLLPHKVFYRYCPELEQASKTPSGVPVYLQLLGSDPGCLADNAARAEALGAAGIDLNFGCPAKTVNKHRGGSVLLDDPTLIHDIVSRIRNTLTPTTPLSVKIRLGYADTSPLLEVAGAVADAGASELVIHARTKAQGYRPPAHWEAIARVRESVNIPLIANGEVWCVEDYRRCRELSGCKDVMLGRGMLAHPALAQTLRDAQHPGMAWQEVLMHLIDFQQDLMVTCPPRHACSPLKQWLAYLQWHFREAGLLLGNVKRVTDASTMLQRLTQEQLKIAA